MEAMPTAIIAVAIPILIFNREKIFFLIICKRIKMAKKSKRQTRSPRSRSPRSKQNQSHRLFIVLDLDETLVHSIEPKRSSKFYSKLPYKTHKMGDEFIVCERPGLQKFLDKLFSKFDVIVWSAGSPDYVAYIDENIISSKKRKTKAVLNSDDCDRSEKEFGERKALKMLWDHLDIPGCGPYNTVIIDDLKENAAHQPGNCIRIRPFIANTNEKNKNDKELQEVLTKLQDIQNDYNSEISYRFKPVR